jgi:cytochrome c6
MLQRLLIFLVTVFWAWTIALPTPVLAANVTNAPKLFEFHCSGCHVNGGNIVRRGKNLKLKTLEKNGVATIAAIETLVTNGKGNMSAYRDRLTPEEIQQVSAYVLEQANQDWR